MMRGTAAVPVVVAVVVLLVMMLVVVLVLLMVEAVDIELVQRQDIATQSPGIGRYALAF
jgi:hypothetical protein